MAKKINKGNGKRCRICKHSPAYDYNDLVEGRLCVPHYFQLLFAAIAAVAVIGVVISIFI